MRRAVWCAVLLSPVLAAGNGDLFQAMRNGDTARVKELLESGASPNQRNEMGATALMYAGAIASVDCVRILLDAGADVNASSDKGATALMWSTGNITKLKLLLSRGAEINGRTNDRITALVTAARRGNVEAVRLLLKAGANPELSGERGGKLIPLAFSAGNPELRRVLTRAGVAWKEPADLGPMQSLIRTLIDPQRMREYLDLGGDPNATVALRDKKISLLAAAALARQQEIARLLMERGADPNFKNMRGWTALMMAATRSRPDLLRLLIQNGADLQAQDEAGLTAMDWALTQGETESATSLRQVGLKRGVPLPPAPSPVEAPRSVREAVQRATSVLEPIGPIFFKKSGCISCHHNSLPEAALNIARRRGVAVNEQAASHAGQATFAFFRAQYEELMLAGCSPGLVLDAGGKGMLGLGEEGVPPSAITDALTSCLAVLQERDGSWGSDGLQLRPPLNPTRISSSALAIYGLRRYSPPGLRQETETRIARAVDYLVTVTPVDTQDHAFKLLGLVWAGAPPAEVARQADRLLALQREDGGWGQLPGMASDAYATGEVLYALYAHGLSPKHPAYSKGVDSLLRTQLADGSWFVRSRAFGFQPYKEYGFPHGPDQFISAAATSWAVIALANTL